MRLLMHLLVASCRSHLESTYDSAQTQEDLALLRQQAESDAAGGLGVVAIPVGEAGREAVVAAAVANCKAQMAADRKTTALKSLQVGGWAGGLLALWWGMGRERGLTAAWRRRSVACPPAKLTVPTPRSFFAPQGHIWAGGFARGELKGELFADVPDALAQWRGAGIKTYIYSSGSRGAQKDLLGCTRVGDLRPYLAGFFDTTSGPKVCGGGGGGLLERGRAWGAGMAAGRQGRRRAGGAA